MKKITFILLLFLVTNTMDAQLGISFGAKTAFLSSKSFREFKNSYNTTLKDGVDGTNSMTNKMGGFMPQFGFGYAVDAVLFDILLIDIRFSNLYGATKCKWENKEVRYFNFSQTSFFGGVGFVKKMDEYYVSLSVGLITGTDKIKSSWKYIDGTRSYGKDHIYSGVYDRTYLSYCVSLQVGHSLSDNMYAYGLFDLVFGSAFSDPQELSDDNILRGADANVYPAGLPTDVKAFNDYYNSGTGNLSSFEYVKADFGGPRFEFGIRYLLFNNY